MPRTRSWFLVVLLVLVFRLVGPLGGIQPSDDLLLPAPAYPEAVQRWQDGSPHTALDSLDALAEDGPQEIPLEAVVLRATLLGEVGRHEDAERAWHAAIARQPWIRTFARRALVELLVRYHQPERAEPVLQELTETDARRHRDLVLLVADAYRDAGATRNAARLYRQLSPPRQRGPIADAARLGLALALEAEGDTDAALRVIRETRLLHARADAYRQATDHERRLVERLNTARLTFDESEYRTLVRRLRNASRSALARAVIEEWRDAHPLTARPDRIDAEWIETLYAERANETAVTAAQRFYRDHPVSGLGPQIRLTEFRLAVRMTDTERARRLGLDLWQGRVPGATASQRRSAAVLLAAYLTAVGDLDGGLELYRELFRTSTDPDDQRAYLWRAGVAALRAGQDERALTNLRSLLNRNPGGDLAPAALYWLGAAEQRRDPTRAVETFRRVRARFPFHYYSIRAGERLEQITGTRPPIPGGSIEFPALRLPEAVSRRAEFKAAMVLARAGLVSDAAWYLRHLLDQQRGSALALLAARASDAAADHAAASRIVASYFGRFLRQPADGLPADFWLLAYPRPFWDDVQTAAFAAGVDPVLLVSLMRQESRFDPAARSPVGAVGLFQIMPYTASALGREAGLGSLFEGDVDDATLMQPAVNAALAARLAANLLELFDGEFAPVIASYNAGEDRVAVWWSASSRQGEDVFVDSIPYSETRRFVREVLTNYATYRRVYAE